MPKFPFRDDMQNRWAILGIWVFSLAATALLPFISMDGSWGGWFSVLINAIIAFSTLITTFLVVFSFRRTMSHPVAFVICIALTMLVMTLAFLPVLASPKASLALQSTRTFFLVITIDLSFATLCIAWWWGWYRRGGWVLLAITPIVWIWTPIIVVRATSPDYAILWLTGASSMTQWINILMMLPCYAMPFGLLATLISLWRTIARELNGS